jgi:hypothetical protein
LHQAKIFTDSGMVPGSVATAFIIIWLAALIVVYHVSTVDTAKLYQYHDNLPMFCFCCGERGAVIMSKEEFTDKRAHLF